MLSLPKKHRSSQKEVLSLKDVSRERLRPLALQLLIVSIRFIFLPVLLIIKLQADIEKLSKTATTDVDFEKMKGGFLLNPRLQMYGL